MLTYNVEKFSDVAVEMIPLWKAHWREIAADQDKIALAPDINRYLAMQDSKNLFTMTVRDDAKLIGYCIMFITNHIHYANTVFAMNDVIYLDPKYRKGMTGITLIKNTEKSLREIGVDKVTWHVKFEVNFGPILERLGYKKSEVIYSKYIGE